MSTLLVYSIKDDINYEQSASLSKKLVSYCLDKNLGVIFNFLGYSEDLISQLDSNLYFKDIYALEFPNVIITST